MIRPNQKTHTDHLTSARSFYNAEVKNWKSIRTKFFYFIRRDWDGYIEQGKEIEQRWSIVLDMMSLDDRILFTCVEKKKHSSRIYKHRSRGNRIKPMIS
jgi:hypothetical protein